MSNLDMEKKLNEANSKCDAIIRMLRDAEPKKQHLTPSTEQGWKDYPKFKPDNDDDYLVYYNDGGYCGVEQFLPEVQEFAMNDNKIIMYKPFERPPLPSQKDKHYIKLPTCICGSLWSQSLDRKELFCEECGTIKPLDKGEV